MRAFVQLYLVLGLDPNQESITEQEVKAAYRAKSKELHPDKEGGSEEAMAALNHAYSILKDPKLRAKYDATGIGETVPEKAKIEGVEVLYKFFVQVIAGETSSEMDQLAKAFGVKLPEEAGAYARKDFIASIRTLANTSLKYITEQIDHHRSKAGQLDDMLKRLHFKPSEPGKPDVLRGMMTAEKSQHESAIATGENRFKEVEAVLKILDDYTYTFTPPAQRPRQKGNSFFKDEIVGATPDIIIVDDLATLAEEFSKTFNKTPHTEQKPMKTSNFGQKNDEFNRRRSRK